MAPPKKNIEDLTDESKEFSVKVRVVEKLRPQISPNKTMYQKIHMKGDQGDEIGAVLYGENIHLYEKVVEYQREYEISNAIIRPVRHHMQKVKGKFEMDFTTRKAVIRPLFSVSDDCNLPNYCEIASIRCVAPSEDCYDLLGVLLSLEDLPTMQCGDANTSYKREASVRELVVADPRERKQCFSQLGKI